MKRITKRVTSLTIDNWLSCYSRNIFEPEDLTQETIDIVLEIFEITKQLQATGGDDRKELWIKAPRCTLKQFEKYYYSDDDYTPEEVEQDYLYTYPDKYKWYHAYFQHCPYGENGTELYAVFIDCKYAFSVNHRSKGSWNQFDGTHIAEWLKTQVEDSIKMLKDNTYGEQLKKELPYRFRSGKIRRSAFWDILPEQREAYRSAIGEDSIAKFLAAPPDDAVSARDFTARRFYEACAVVYKAVGMEYRDAWRFKDVEEENARYGGQTAKEMYYAHADGRDNGLMNVPIDDPQAFRDWYDEKPPYYEFNGSHPYEIIPSGSVSFSLHLHVYRENDGFMLGLSGSMFGRTPDTIKAYLALRDAGYSPFIFDYEDIASRLRETDMIEVQPVSVRNFYGTGSNGCLDAVCFWDDDENADKISQLITATEWKSLEKTYSPLKA